MHYIKLDLILVLLSHLRNENYFFGCEYRRFIFFSNDTAWKSFVKLELQRQFKMTDLGESKFCVGLRIFRDRQKGVISLDQQRHILDLLDKFNMTECNTVSTAMDPNQKLTNDMSPKTSEEREAMSHVPYQELVGGLLYISQGSRPDITYAVNTVGKFNNNPGQAHWIAVKRILRYLKATLAAKVTYSRKGNADMLGFCDADWASCVDDRRSCTGYVFIMQGGAISWNSKRQQTIALSTAEAEYMAISSSIQEYYGLVHLSKNFNWMVIVN